jgi:nitrogen fixation protein NifU and related proteins
MYNRTAMDHFLKPRSVGEVATGARGEALNAECGDTVLVTVRLEDGRVAEAKFRSKGCAGAIAACSATMELATGKAAAEALAIDVDAVDRHLGGMPPSKRGCLEMAVAALRSAVAAANG